MVRGYVAECREVVGTRERGSGVVGATRRNWWINTHLQHTSLIGSQKCFQFDPTPVRPSSNSLAFLPRPRPGFSVQPQHSPVPRQPPPTSTSLTLLLLHPPSPLHSLPHERVFSPSLSLPAHLLRHSCDTTRCKTMISSSISEKMNSNYTNLYNTMKKKKKRMPFRSDADQLLPLPPTKHRAKSSTYRNKNTCNYHQQQQQLQYQQATD